MIRIPLEFVSVDGAFGWLLNEASRAALKDGIETGAVDRTAGETMLRQDEEARAMDGAFVGHVVFEDATMALSNAVYAEAARRAREQAEAEDRRAREAGQSPRYGLTPELIGITVHAIRPEMTFLRMEGDGAAAYTSWASIPNQVKSALPGLLEGHYVLPNDLAEVLKKKGAKSRKATAR